MLVLAACASRNTYSTPVVDRAAVVRAGPPVPAAQVWMLEQSGPSPVDTVVRFLPSVGRTVLLRHQPPDNAVYAIVEFAPVSGGGDDSVTVTISPSPGRFGLDIRTSAALTPARVTFSYATHFSAPSESVAQYANPTRFEQAMGAARLRPDGMIEFVETSRPAADMMQFSAATQGTYVLAAPR